jgi:hypothetical protein
VRLLSGYLQPPTVRTDKPVSKRYEREGRSGQDSDQTRKLTDGCTMSRFSASLEAILQSGQQACLQRQRWLLALCGLKKGAARRSQRELGPHVVSQECRPQAVKAPGVLDRPVCLPLFLAGSGAAPPMSTYCVDANGQFPNSLSDEVLMASRRTRSANTDSFPQAMHFKRGGRATHWL